MKTDTMGAYGCCGKSKNLLSVFIGMYVLDLSIMMIEIGLTVVMNLVLFPSMKRNLAYLIVYPGPFIPFILEKLSR